MRVIGIDPGLRRTGWGVLDARAGRLTHVASGVCEGRGELLSDRLLAIFDGLSAVLARFSPDAAAVEKTFVNKDAAGTLKLGQARGVALLAPARAGLAVAEYAPNEVKKAIVGVGHAGKAQVAHMVAVLLTGATPAGPDATDALAVALCHAHRLEAGGRLAAALARAEARG
jgi:crossover junction endodeoxyribonuclease RuvC